MARKSGYLAVLLALAASVTAQDLGLCPPNDIVGICVVPDNACGGDADCAPGGQICCSQGCNRVCVDPLLGCIEQDCMADTVERCLNEGVRVAYENGCPICECEEHICNLVDCQPDFTCDRATGQCVPLVGACEPVMCEIFCEFGFQIDDRGCEVCACRPNPCNGVLCGPADVCVTRVIDVVCVTTPCPPQVIVRCVNPTPRDGDCPNSQMIWPCDGDIRHHCSLDNQCETNRDQKCCPDACGMNRCVAPAPVCEPLTCEPLCEFGVVYDDVGCTTCDCYEPCATVLCEPGYSCEGLYPPCPAGTPPHLCRAIGTCVRQCPEVLCDLACGPLGFKRDESGCAICECLCPAVACSAPCRYGTATDMYGCPSCDCFDPCKDLDCSSSGRVCAVSDPICEGCRHTGTCVVSAVKPGTCPRLALFGWLCGDQQTGDQCADDAGCPGDEKCCPTLCGNRCSPPLRAEGECPMVLTGGDSLYDEYNRLAEWSPALPPIGHLCTYHSDCRSNAKCCDSFTGRKCMRPLPPGRRSREGAIFFRFLMRVFAGGFRRQA